jgi:hypothetical protein
MSNLIDIKAIHKYYKLEQNTCNFLTWFSETE